MPSDRYVPLTAPDLVSTIDLRPYIFDQIRSASNNQIYDFSPHSPVVAIVEGLDFSIRELQSTLNQLAFSLSVNNLKIAGIQQRLGTKAIVDLTFTLTAPLNTVFTLSSGYIVSDGASHQFTTDTVLFIYPGNVSATVSATAIIEGAAWNVGINALTAISETRAYLSSVTNLQPAQGGTDPETFDQTIARGFEALRSRESLITADDFEAEAEMQLGAGSLARAIGNLAADQTSIEVGTVHLFILNADGTAPTTVQCTALESSFQNKIPTFLGGSKTSLISTGVYVSPVEFTIVNLDIIASMVSGDDPSKRSQTILSELKRYFFPGALDLGATVILKEVENVIRQCGVQYVQSVFFTGDLGVSYADLPLSNQWSVATLKGVQVALVDEFNNTYKYSFV